jgi:hypothetical protein
MFSGVSNFIHARGNLSNGRIWRSNGPVYSAQGVLLLLLAKFAQPSLALSRQANILFTYNSRRRYLRKLDRKLCGFVKREVIL